MKSLLIASVLVASSLALAHRDDDWGVGGPKVKYQSYCSQDRFVKVPNGDGTVKVIYDCALIQKVCKNVESKQGPYLFVSATCVPRSQAR